MKINENAYVVRTTNADLVQGQAVKAVSDTVVSPATVDETYFGVAGDAATSGSEATIYVRGFGGLVPVKLATNVVTGGNLYVTGSTAYFKATGTTVNGIAMVSGSAGDVISATIR